VVRNTGRGTAKTPVVAMIERGGDVRVQVVADVTGETLKGILLQHVEPTTRIFTDELSSYRGLSKTFADHQAVNHSKKEYVRGDVHVNGSESFFSLLKRSIVGAFHHVSKKHLPKYCDEVAFRWDHRKTLDLERTFAALAATEGKRLMYREPLERRPI
jgi:transposase-like protein